MSYDSPQQGPTDTDPVWPQPPVQQYSPPPAPPPYGYAPPQQGYAPVPYQAPPARKDSGLAIVFSLLLPGAGHLYVSDNSVGIPFTVISAINLLLSFTLIWLIIGIPLWIGTAIFTTIDSSKKANAYNARFGV